LGNVLKSLDASEKQLKENESSHIKEVIDLGEMYEKEIRNQKIGRWIERGVLVGIIVWLVLR
jgi:hypothetical protein